MTAVMRFVPVREGRTRVEPTADGVRVVVPVRRTWWRVLSTAYGVLFMAAVIVALVTGSVESESTGGTIFFVAFALAFLVLFGGSAAWMVAGREEIVLDPQALVHVRRIGPLARSRAYERTSVEDLRVSPDSLSPFDFRASLRMLGWGGGTVAFDYGDSTYRVADVEEAEAKRIVAALGERL
jgi:hypothetical protein